MSEHKPRKSTENKMPKAFGWMAEYSDEHSLLTAARKVRDSGYTKTDAFTPFPVHGIDEALGIKPTGLPWFVLCGGFTGLTIALLMQWWMNGVDYKYIISGKPFGITPASIPVAFELTILFSAFTSFFAMIALNGLPKFSNPVFTNPRFDRATNDKFFLYVNAADKYYNRESVKELLAGTSPDSLDEVIEDSSPSTLPRAITLGALLLVLTGLIPAMIILNMRAGFSDLPRLHVFFDMDFQPKKKAQQTTTIFSDGRTMRPQVKGTIARGQLEEQDPYYLGYDPSKVTALSPADSVMLVSLQQPTDQPPTDQPPADEKPAEEKPAEDKPATQPPADEKPADQPPAETKPADEKPADPVPQEPGKTEETPKPAEPPKSEDKPATPAAQTPAPATTPAAPAGQASGSTPALNLPWVTELPLEASVSQLSPEDKEKYLADYMKLGKTKFEIYCSACHGYTGNGDGLVHKRADSLAQGYWLPPTSMHIDRVRNQPVGQIFHTVTKGQGKMPSYAASLTPKERWAVVLYVKALQLSRNATIDDVPTDQRAKLDSSEKPSVKK